MNHAVQDSEPSSPTVRRRLSPGGLLTLVNGILAGVGGVYATTGSVAITIIAGLTALFLGTLMILRP